jgi:hypothetical protein
VLLRRRQQREGEGDCTDVLECQWRCCVVMLFWQ